MYSSSEAPWPAARAPPGSAADTPAAVPGRNTSAPARPDAPPPAPHPRRSASAGAGERPAGTPMRLLQKVSTASTAPSPTINIWAPVSRPVPPPPAPSAQWPGPAQSLVTRPFSVRNSALYTCCRRASIAAHDRRPRQGRDATAIASSVDTPQQGLRLGPRQPLGRRHADAYPGKARPAPGATAMMSISSNVSPAVFSIPSSSGISVTLWVSPRS